MDLDRTVNSIRAASAATEARFVTIGERLESSIGTLAGLTNTFHTLSAELTGPDLQQATDNLSTVATRVSTLAKAQTSGVEAFRALLGLVPVIEGRIARMGKSVDGVAMLATNAKIAAANIGDGSIEFSRFAAEISRTLQLAKISLEQFSSEFTSVGRLLHAGMQTQTTSEERQAAAVQAIPARLAESVGAIVTRADGTATIATTVSQRSERIVKRISDAVMALQIGDVTRQRLDHVDYALGLLDDIQNTTGAAARQTGAEWTALSRGDYDAVSQACHRLQAGQLNDAADKLKNDAHEIIASLQDLAAEAQKILQLSHDAVGATQSRQGTFLGRIKDQIDEVTTLLANFRTARQEADHVARSVCEATSHLTKHLAVVREMEADIRIMGLNITFKGSRLGSTGLPLSIIARELRVYSNEIAAEAAEVTTDLDQVLAFALGLSTQDQHEATAEIESITDIMAAALQRLSDVNRSLEFAFQTLEQDGQKVSTLLTDAIGRTKVHEEIVQTIRQAARDLSEAARGSAGYDVAQAPAQVLWMFESIADSYTMDAERQVIATCGPRGLPIREAPAADASLEDIFF